MNWHALILILIVIPDPIRMRETGHKIKINRAMYTIPQRRFQVIDPNNPKEIMAALNSLPSIAKVNETEYMLTEMERMKELQKALPSFKLNTPLFFDPKYNQNRLEFALPKTRRTSDYVLKQIERAIKRNRSHDPRNSRRRFHNHDNPNEFLKEMQAVPDLESMIPPEYIKSHPQQFKKFHSVSGRDVAKDLQMKHKMENSGIPAMQFIEMHSMKNLRKYDKDHNSDETDERMIFKPKRQINQPILSEQNRDHVGNSLFSLLDKRLLGAHSFPKKKAVHSLYGNLDSLGLKGYQDSIELHKQRIKKFKTRTPYAQKQPELLFNKDHPGLNLLYNKKMWLEAAKFAKSNKHLVYGNLNNLGLREGGSNRYQHSDFRRSNKLRRSGFQRLNRGILSRKPVARQNKMMERKQKKVLSQNSHKKYYRNSHKITQQRNNKKHQILRGGKKPHANAKTKKGSGSKLVYGNKKILGIRTNDQTKNETRLVYGNYNGDYRSIRYDKTPYVWLYTDFRKRPRKRKLSFRTKNKANITDKPVYGNYEDGYRSIRYGKEPFVTLYSDFRKNSMPALIQKKLNRYEDDYLNEDSENVIMSALQAIDVYDKKHRRGKYSRLAQTIALQAGDLNKRNKKYRSLKYYLDDEIDERENGAHEIIEPYENDSQNLRRSHRKYTDYSKGDDNNTLCSKKSSSSSSSGSSDEKNPGNPYTVFKNKYHQNWMWNHFMDGDHMNINPYGPKFDSLGPSGNALFFGRKWWYFNQDDYKPFRKR